MAENKYARKKRLEEDERKDESNPYINAEDDENEDEFVEELDENEEELKSIAAEADIDDASHSDNDEEASEVEDNEDINVKDDEEILATDNDDDDEPQRKQAKSKKDAKLKKSLAKNATLKERKRCLKLTHISKIASRMGVSFNVKQAVADGLSVQNAAKAIMRAARENRESYALTNIPPQRSDRFSSSQSVSASKINNMWAKVKRKK